MLLCGVYQQMGGQDTQPSSIAAAATMPTFAKQYWSWGFHPGSRTPAAAGARCCSTEGAAINAQAMAVK